MQIDLPVDGVFRIVGRGRGRFNARIEHEPGIGPVAHAKVELLRDAEAEYHLLGALDNGELVTLSGCRVRSVAPSVGGAPNTDLIISAAFFGDHFRRASDVRFRTLRARYTHLSQWALRSGFAMRAPHARTINIRYRQPAPLKLFEFADGIEVYLDTIASRPTYEAPIQRSAEVRQWHYIRFAAQHRVPFESLREKTQVIGDFLTLAVSELCWTREIIAYRDGVDPTQRSAVLMPHEEIPDIDNLIFSDMMLLPRRAAGRRLRRHIGAWVRKYDVLGEVVRLYTLAISTPRMQPVDRFLTLVFALESLHRRTRENNEVSESAHRARIQAILNVAPSDQRGWLQEKLRYSNQRTLRGRLREYFGQIDGVLAPWSVRASRLIGQIVDSRNFYVHRDDAITGVVRGAALYWLMLKVRCLLECCLLIEIGLTPNEVADRVRDNPRFQRVFEH